MNTSYLKQKNAKIDKFSILFFIVIYITYFVIQAIFFNSNFRPDELKAINFFANFINVETDLRGEFLIRLTLFSLNSILVFILFNVGLINNKTISLALIWPLTAFLFSKIYWEFYYFPLCLLSLTKTKKTDSIIIVVLLGLFAITGEDNLLVLLTFRAVILAQKYGFKKLAPLIFLTSCFIISWLIDAGFTRKIPIFGQELTRFGWTRDIVNPEYSITETIAVFLSSMHFFTMHGNLWQVDLFFTVIVLIIIALSVIKYKIFKEEVYFALTFVCILIGFSTITHVFQNARYYYFIIPIIAMLIDRKAYLYILFLGLIHVSVKCVEVII